MNYIFVNKTLHDSPLKFNFFKKKNLHITKKFMSEDFFPIIFN